MFTFAFGFAAGVFAFGIAAVSWLVSSGAITGVLPPKEGTLSRLLALSSILKRSFTTQKRLDRVQASLCDASIRVAVLEAEQAKEKARLSRIVPTRARMVPSEQVVAARH
jgi:hypothetical protein